MMRSWQDGRFKLAAVARLLALRRAEPALFAEGGYEPVVASGPDADQILAFTRRTPDQTLLIAVARFPAGHESGGAPDAILHLGLRGSWRDVLEDRDLSLEDETHARDLFADESPVAVLQLKATRSQRTATRTPHPPPRD
jgi:(1->4)-alpha-D-glucan 1-alpha-D-glucosylmutase